MSMKCPSCGLKTEVTDSRPQDDTVWRRRSCPNGHRLTTLEVEATTVNGKIISVFEQQARNLRLKLLTIKDAIKGLDMTLGG